MTLTSLQRPPAGRSEPAWDIARLYPDQGYWTEIDYLELDTKHLVEFSDGFVEVLEMPTPSHQRIVRRLGDSLAAVVEPSGKGCVFLAPLPVKVREGRFREPDVVLLLTEHLDRLGKMYCQGADLVMEVVSEDAKSHVRDWIAKRSDYAEGGIPEYWIVDPTETRVTVLRLAGKEYVSHGDFVPGQRATSALVSGFSIDVAEIFAAGDIEALKKQLRDQVQNPEQ